MPLKILYDVEKSGLVSCKRKHDVYQCSGNTTLCIDSCGWLPVLLVHLYVVFHVWYARMYESGAGAVLERCWYRVKHPSLELQMGDFSGLPLNIIV